MFAALAVGFAVMASLFRASNHDLGFAAMAAPVFFIAACMGLRRSPAWTMGEEGDPDAE